MIKNDLFIQSILIFFFNVCAAISSNIISFLCFNYNIRSGDKEVRNLDDAMFLTF